MTIENAIAKCDAANPNSFDNTMKVELLSRLDGLIKTEVFDHYETDDGEGFEGYTDNTPSDTVLLVPFPFDHIYVSWLIAHVYLYFGEHNKYNVWIGIYNNELEAFERHYAQTHTQKSPNNFTYF